MNIPHKSTCILLYLYSLADQLNFSTWRAFFYLFSTIRYIHYLFLLLSIFIFVIFFPIPSSLMQLWRFIILFIYTLIHSFSFSFYRFSFSFYIFLWSITCFYDTRHENRWEKNEYIWSYTISYFLPFLLHFSFLLTCFLTETFFFKKKKYLY